MKLVSHRSILAVSCGWIAIYSTAPAHAQTPAAPQRAESAQSAEADSEIVVTGLRASISDGLNTKRNASVVLDSISAIDIGKLPDQNVSETLSRIPGVQISRREGEGARINVRGIDRNTTQLNGRTFVGSSTNGDPNLSDFPSEILASVDVIKSPSADLVEGWLGAIINLKTRRPLDLREDLVSARLQGSYATKIEDVGGKGSFAYGTSLGDFGFLISGTVANTPGRTDAFSNRGYARLTGVPLSGPGATAANVFRPNRLETYVIEYESQRYGLNGTLQWRPLDNLTFTLDALTADTKTERSRFVNQVLLSNAFSNVNVLADGTVDSATVTGVTVRPIIFDGPNENRADAIALGAKWTSNRLEVNANASVSSGDSNGGNDQGSQSQLWFAGNDHVLVTRQLAGNTASATYSNLRDRAAPNFALTGNYNLSDASQYEGFTVVDNRYINENDGRDFDVDATYDVNSWVQSIKVGARYENVAATQFFDIRTYTAAQLAAGDPTPGTPLLATETPGLTYSGTRSNVLEGDGGVFPRSVLAGTFDINRFRNQFNGANPSPADLAQRQAGLLDIEQTTIAYFAKADFGGQLGDWDYSGNVGVRQVETEREAFGFDRTGATTTRPRSDTSEFTDTLPSLNLALNPTEDVTLRFAAAKVLARPALNLTGVGINFNPTAGTGSAGNPDLEPFRATQYDVSAEWYFAKASLLSVSLFHKDVSAFTRTVTTVEDHPEIVAPGLTNTLYSISRPVNGTDGEIKGVEINYFHAFTFLPAPFDGLGVNLGYTRAEGTTPNRDELTGQTLSLPNLSEDSLNLVAYYEKDAVSMRLAYNYRSDYLLAQQPASLGGSLYHNDYGQLDASFSYKLNDKAQITVDALNLTGELRSIYTGTENRLTTSWQDSRRLLVGIGLTF